MPTVYHPNDPGDPSLIQTLKAQVASIAQAQVAGINRVYTQAPDGPLENNSLYIGQPKIRIRENADTNGKCVYIFRFPCMHLFSRRGRGSDALNSAESYVMPYLLAFSTAVNQSLNNHARSVTVTEGVVTQGKEADYPGIFFFFILEVEAEFNFAWS